jgi:hypothetical protein
LPSSARKLVKASFNGAATIRVRGILRFARVAGYCRLAILKTAMTMNAIPVITKIGNVIK